MNRTQTIATRIVALAIAIGATASTSAHALPHVFGIHRHPAAQTADARVTVYLTNKSEIFTDIKVDGHVYTVLPEHTITITAPLGTPVYTESIGGAHQKGDLLFAVGPQMQRTHVSLN
jgi:hypothetical protein